MTLTFPHPNTLSLLDQRRGRSSSCSRTRSGSRSMRIPSDSPSAMSFSQSIFPLEIIARSLFMPDRIPPLASQYFPNENRKVSVV